MCKMDYLEIDPEILIGLVKSRPVLWDKSEEGYKDRNATRNAWEEVCIGLSPRDFLQLEEKEKSAFTKEVTRRWGNVRDAYAKSLRKDHGSNKSGSGASVKKKYIYSRQLEFMKKVYVARDVEENTAKEEGNTEKGEGNIEKREENIVKRKENIEKGEENDVSRVESDSAEEAEGNVRPTGPTPSKKRRKMDDFEYKVLKALEGEKPSRHLMFFKGVIPALENYTEHEILLFQIGVLNLIANINDQKRRVQQSIRPSENSSQSLSS